MVAPRIALGFGDGSDALHEDGRHASRQMQIERCVGRRDETQQARVQRHQFIYRRCHQVRYQAQIHRIVDGHGVGEHRRIERDIVEAILRGMIGDDDGREDLRNIAAGFLGQFAAFVELPEIGIAGLLNGVLHTACAPVVAGHGEIPIAQLVINELHVAGVGARGFLRIEALVHVRRARQSVEFVVGHELPHTASVRVAIKSARIEARLGHRQIDQVLRHALFGHHPLDHRLVAAAALEGVEQRVVALLRVGKEIDVGGHIVVHDQRQIGVGCGQIGSGFGHQFGVNNEGHVFGGLGRRGLLFGHKSIALLESVHLERAHAVHNAVELLLQLGIASDVDAGGEHEVDGAIKLLFGLNQSPFVIVGLAAGVGVLHLLDEHAYPLLLTGKRGRHGSGGERGLRNWHKGGRCGLWPRNVASACGSCLLAACQRES